MTYLVVVFLGGDLRSEVLSQNIRQESEACYKKREYSHPCREMGTEKSRQTGNI
jgi:hypothetical protein